VLGLWETVGRASNPLLAVPPSAVLPALRDLLLLRSYPDLPANVLLTLREIAAAYALAVVAGLACGFALGFHWLIGRAWGPMLAALYAVPRSEEHTSELQSLAYLVCRLPLEKKKHDL